VPGGITLLSNLDNNDPLLVAAPSCTVDGASFGCAFAGRQPGDRRRLTLLDVPIDYDGTPLLRELDLISALSNIILNKHLRARVRPVVEA